jgi:hypothetical protein
LHRPAVSGECRCMGVNYREPRPRRGYRHSAHGCQPGKGIHESTGR